MRQIHITRDARGTVTFETVSIDATENVFFTNMDPKSAHWPTLLSNQLGASPSPNSSQTPVTSPDSTPAPYQVTYGCKIAGHSSEKGIINVLPPLTPSGTGMLAAATAGKPIAEQQVVAGGVAPYMLTGQFFDVVDANNNVMQSGAGIGPGLQLNASTSDKGITVTGTPSVVGTYKFTFTVNDAIGRNLQQTQYSMLVNAGAA
jgi:hypothetical protein